MLFLLFLYSASTSNALSAPLAVAKSDNFLLGDPPSSSTCMCPSQRSVWDITWSCLATIFACSWVAVHPDIPSPDVTPWKITRRRLELMFWTLITPELVIFWAARQWYGARKIERSINNRLKAEWTRTHAHFAQMGGYTLFDEEKPVSVLSVWYLQNLCLEGRIKLPRIHKRDIEDRSKSDGLSKIFVIGQTTWFIIQVIARGAHGLVITELEIATLAFASLNALMYFFWWDKPMDVHSSIPVRLIKIQSPVEVEAETDITETISPTTFTSYPPADYKQEESPSPKSRPSSVNAFNRLLSSIQSGTAQILISLVYWPGYLIYSIGNGFCKIINNHAEAIEFDAHMKYNEPGPSRVPRYYAIRTDDKDENPMIILASFSGAFFGAIHCVCWAFAFPSGEERIIWRVCSLLITVVPVLGGVALVTIRAHSLTTYGSCRLVAFCLNLVPLYFLARVIIIIEALITLRDLPEGAFDIVVWTTFIPHI